MTHRTNVLLHHGSGGGHDHDHDHDHTHDHDHGHGHGHGRARAIKPGVLLAAFGVASDHARRGYALMEAEIRAERPDVPVVWAYTAHKVRRKLAAMGQAHDSLAEALSRLHDAGVTHLAVQSLHTAPGVEYHWTRAQALAFQHPRKGFQAVAIGTPLLDSDDDLVRACQALAGYIPPERRPQEAVVLVGHGTYHQGQQRYLDFEACVRQGDPHVFLGALMRRPGEELGVAAVLDRVRRAGLARCWLLPFMSVPGHHVQVDILGDSPRSWKGQMEAAGIEVRGCATGTLEHAPFRAIWMEHLRQAWAALQGEHAASRHDHDSHGKCHGGCHAHL